MSIHKMMQLDNTKEKRKLYQKKHIGGMNYDPKNLLDIKKIVEKPMDAMEEGELIIPIEPRILFEEVLYLPEDWDGG